MLLFITLSLLLHPLFSLKQDQEPCMLFINIILFNSFLTSFVNRSHLSCETCIIDKGCGWCSSNQCVSLEDASCQDIVTQCMLQI